VIVELVDIDNDISKTKAGNRCVQILGELLDDNVNLSSFRNNTT